MQAILPCQRPDRTYDVVSGPKEILCHFKRELLTEKPKEKQLCTKFRLTIVETSKVRVEVFNLQTTYVFVTSGNWQSVSSDAKDLVRRMLELEPSARITTAQILAHPWLTSRNQPTTHLVYHDKHLLKVCKLVGRLEDAHTHAPELKNLLLCKINSFINLFVHILIKCQSCFIQSNAKLATIL